MSYISDYEYYENNGNTPTSVNWGSYQNTSLVDLVNNFMLNHVGPDELITKVARDKVIFHIKSCIQELNYDALRVPKILELNITGTNQMIFPPDFVGFLRISYESQGILYVMAERRDTNFSNSYLQDNNGGIVFDVNGNVIEVQSQLDVSRLNGDTRKLYVGDGDFNDQYGWYLDGNWYFGRAFGGHYSLDPELANSNPTFSIDYANGVINFDSGMSGKNVVLEYVSDGLFNGDDSKIHIHKFAERAIYDYTLCRLLKSRRGIPDYEKRRYERASKAQMDNAKIRMSGNTPERLLMVLRKQGEWIK